jgi:hypothetical protein
LRIKDVTALGFYGGSLVKYDEGGADFAEYEVGIAPATLVTQINATGGGGSGWGLSGNSGTDPLTNFIGTTDEAPLVLRSNDRSLLIIDGDADRSQITSYDQLGTLTGVSVFLNENVGILEGVVAGVSTTIIQWDETDIRFQTNELERVIIDNDGNVGIGTGTPTEILDVVGNIQATGNVSVTDVGSGFILKSPDGTPWKIEVSDLGVLSVVVVP